MDNKDKLKYNHETYTEMWFKIKTGHDEGSYMQSPGHKPGNLVFKSRPTSTYLRYEKSSYCVDESEVEIEPVPFNELTKNQLIEVLLNLYYIVPDVNKIKFLLNLILEKHTALKHSLVIQKKILFFVSKTYGSEIYEALSVSEQDKQFNKKSKYRRFEMKDFSKYEGKLSNFIFDHFRNFRFNKDRYSEYEIKLVLSVLTGVPIQFDAILQRKDGSFFETTCELSESLEYIPPHFGGSLDVEPTPGIFFRKTDDFKYNRIVYTEI